MDLDTAELTGIVIQSALYSIYLLVTAASIYCMYYVRGRKIAPNKIVMYVSVGLLLIITTFYVLSVYRVVKVLATYEGSSRRVLGFLEFNSPEIIRMSSYALVIISMDCLLAYRLYIIYLNNVWIIILPTLSILGFLGITISEFVLSAQSYTINGPEILKWPITGLALSVFTCTYSTSLIIFRIFQHGRALRYFGTKSMLTPVLYIIIESALVSSALNITVLILLVTGNYTTYFLFVHLFPSSIGLNYSAVLMQIGLGVADIPQLRATLPTISQNLSFQTPTAADRVRHSIDLTITRILDKDKHTSMLN